MSARDTDLASSARALEELCRIYRKPILLNLQRKHQLSYHDAEDVAQDFISWLLQHHHFHRADPDLGRFRTFLLTYLGNFVSNHRRRQGAIKRGGQAGEHLLVHDSTDESLKVEIPSQLTPDEEGDRAWALATLSEAYECLRLDYSDRGKENQFSVLKRFLSASDANDSQQAAQELGLTKDALRVATHRFRKDFKAKLTRLVKDTVSNEADLEDELLLIRKFAA